jgi:hypothetical protein
MAGFDFTKLDPVALARDRRLRLDIKESFEAWCRFVLSFRNQVPAAHHLLFIRELEKIARGETMNLIISAPQGCAKTTYASPWQGAAQVTQAVMGGLQARKADQQAQLQQQNVQKLIADYYARQGGAVPGAAPAVPGAIPGAVPGAVPASPPGIIGASPDPNQQVYYGGS